MLRVLVQATMSAVAPTAPSGWWISLRPRRTSTPAAVQGWAPWVAPAATPGEIAAAIPSSVGGLAPATITDTPSDHAAVVAAADGRLAAADGRLAAAGRSLADRVGTLSTSQRPIVRLAGSARPVVAIPIETSSPMVLPWQAPEPVAGVVMRTIRVPVDWPGSPVRAPGTAVVPVAMPAPTIAGASTVAVLPEPCPAPRPIEVAAVTMAPDLPGPVIGQVVQRYVGTASAAVQPILRTTSTRPVVVPSPVDSRRARLGRLGRLTAVAVGMVVSVVAMEAAARLGRR